LLKRKINKPILCCFSAPAGIWDDEIRQLERSGIPNYPTPERAAKALSSLHKFNKKKG
jgi:acyl-CoA synthetase (NDP forming)